MLHLPVLRIPERHTGETHTAAPLAAILAAQTGISHFNSGIYHLHGLAALCISAHAGFTGDAEAPAGNTEASIRVRLLKALEAIPPLVAAFDDCIIEINAPVVEKVRSEPLSKVSPLTSGYYHHHDKWPEIEDTDTKKPRRRRDRGRRETFLAANIARSMCEACLFRVEEAHASPGTLQSYALSARRMVTGAGLRHLAAALLTVA